MSNAALELWLSAKPRARLAAVGSATVAVLSRSGIELPFLCHETGSHAYYNCALYCTCTNSALKSDKRYTLQVCVLGSYNIPHTAIYNYGCLIIMKSTKVQTSPIYRSRALKHIPQSTEPRAVLGSKYVMATPAQFVKLSER